MYSHPCRKCRAFNTCCFWGHCPAARWSISQWALRHLDVADRMCLSVHCGLYLAVNPLGLCRCSPRFILAFETNVAYVLESVLDLIDSWKGVFLHNWKWRSLIHNGGLLWSTGSFVIVHPCVLARWQRTKEFISSHAMFWPCLWLVYSASSTALWPTSLPLLWSHDVTQMAMKRLIRQLSNYFWSPKRVGLYIERAAVPTWSTSYGCKRPQIKSLSPHALFQSQCAGARSENHKNCVTVPSTYKLHCSLYFSWSGIFSQPTKALAANHLNVRVVLMPLSNFIHISAVALCNEGPVKRTDLVRLSHCRRGAESSFEIVRRVVNQRCASEQDT